jgi:hypothetical protein
MLTHQGVTLTVTGWARRLGYPVDVLYQRLHRGWSLERMLVTPDQVVDFRRAKYRKTSAPE